MSNASQTHTLIASELPSDSPEIGDWTSFVRGLTASDAVSIDPAPDAVACTALGCTEKKQLLRAVIDGIGTRVLCAEHLADLIKRELLDDE